MKEIRCDHCQAFLCYRQKGGTLQVWTFTLDLDRSRKVTCVACGKETKIFVESNKDDGDVGLAK